VSLRAVLVEAAAQQLNPAQLKMQRRRQSSAASSARLLAKLASSSEQVPLGRSYSMIVDVETHAGSLEHKLKERRVRADSAGIRDFEAKVRADHGLPVNGPCSATDSKQHSVQEWLYITDSKAYVGPVSLQTLHWLFQTHQISQATFVKNDKLSQPQPAHSETAPLEATKLHEDWKGQSSAWARIRGLPELLARLSSPLEPPTVTDESLPSSSENICELGAANEDTSSYVAPRKCFLANLIGEQEIYNGFECVILPAEGPKGLMSVRVSAAWGEDSLVVHPHQIQYRDEHVETGDESCNVSLAGTTVSEQLQRRTPRHPTWTKMHRDARAEFQQSIQMELEMPCSSFACMQRGHQRPSTVPTPKVRNQIAKMEVCRHQASYWQTKEPFGVHWQTRSLGGAAGKGKAREPCFNTAACPNLSTHAALDRHPSGLPRPRTSHAKTRPSSIQNLGYERTDTGKKDRRMPIKRGVAGQIWIGGCPSAGRTRNSKSFERAHKSMVALPVSLVSAPKRPAVPMLAQSRGGGGGADGNDQWANCKFGRAMHEPVSLGDAVEFVARTQRSSMI